MTSPTINEMARSRGIKNRELKATRDNIRRIEASRERDVDRLRSHAMFPSEQMNAAITEFQSKAGA